jgi:teichuronic acid biosynthesis glycosyltransferase TuaC
MRILCVVNGYPSKDQKDLCPFNRVQINGLRDYTNLRVRLIKINKKRNGLKSYLVAFKLIRRTKWRYDVLHCFHGLTFLTAILANRNAAAKILVSFLNNINLEYCELKYLKHILVAITKLSLKNANVFSIVKNRRETECLPRQFYLPNGINLSVFQPVDKTEAKQNLGLDKNMKYILFVSSKTIDRKQKRYDLFKQVVGFLHAEDCSIRELVVSAVNQSEMKYYYSAAELLLLTSEYEGSPNSVKEAIACSCPVISSDVGDVREILRGVPMCYIYEDAKVETIVRLCRQSMTDRRRNLNISGYIKINGYDVEARTRQLEMVYRNITE